MQIGALTAAFNKDKWPLEKIIDWAGETRIDCLEVLVGSHFNPDEMLKKKEREALQSRLKKAGVTISSLAYYTVDLTSPDAKTRSAAAAKLDTTVEAAEALGLDTVCTLAGFPMPKKSKMDTIRQDLPEVLGPALDKAKKRGVKIALENWYATNIQHLDHWKALFEVLPQENFGLNFDPSHLDMMEIDYMAAVTEFSKRIFHTHAKDVHVDFAKRQRIGRLDGADFRFCIPGTGRIPWGLYIGRLRQVGYNGVLSIEHEDGTLSPVDGFRIGAAYLRQLIA